MQKLFTVFVSLIIPFSLFAQSYSAPESVEYDAANGRYLVSCNGNVNSIQQVIPGQAPTLFTSNVSGPAGIEILGSKLWVCDGGRIKSYNLTTAALIDNITITGASFLNGITSDGGHFLFASDYTAKKIYRINTNTGAFYTMVTLPGAAPAPNGMWYDGANNRVLFVNWGSNAPVKAVSLADSAVTTVVTTTQGNCDGIGRDVAGNYFISSWIQQAVYKYNSSFGSPVAVITGLSNPADIFYNTLNDTIAVPNANNNTVTFHYVGSTVSISEANEKQVMKIYPNPASELLNIEMQDGIKDAELLIKNFNGQVVYQSAISSRKTIINISSIAAGQYFYLLQTEKELFSGLLNILK